LPFPVVAITTAAGGDAGNRMEVTDSAVHPITVATSTANSTFSEILLYEFLFILSLLVWNGGPFSMAPQ
jgi:hypothetical protein